jgi:transcriptional regulator with XRE-family HTH domain
VTTRHEGSPHFAALLREYRDRLRLSQGRLAEACDFDHSYISRLETATRRPSRVALEKIVSALGLSDSDRDALYLAAGFAPLDPLALLDREPELAEVFEVLGDPAIPVDIRDNVRAMLRLLTKQAIRAGQLSLA